MLPQKNRIPRKDFPLGYRQGGRIFSALFSGVVYPSSKGVRVSVVVSKKTAKTAVMRNFLKRRFYALVRPYLKSLSGEVLIILYPKAAAAKAPFSILKIEFEKGIRGANLIR